MGRETSVALKELFERAQTWPEETQAEAVLILGMLDEATGDGDRPLSADDLAAIERGIEDVRAGRVHTLDEVRALFDQYRAR